MAQDLRMLMINRDLRPAYYDDFHCIMSACRLSCCCYSWRIAFDRKDYLKIKKQRGSADLNARLERALHRLHNKDWYGEFVLENGMCPLLRDGLCGLQREKGEKVLPLVCRTFPRREEHVPSGYLERSLSPGCEAVLALLWDRTEGVDFRSDPLPPEKQKTLTLQDDSPLAPYFQEIRSVCIDFLQDRALPLPQRILWMGVALEQLAKEPEHPEDWLNRARAMLADPRRGELCAAQSGEEAGALPLYLWNNVQIVLKNFLDDPEKRKVYDLIRDTLGLRGSDGKGVVNREGYLACRERFHSRFDGHPEFFENLMVSTFFYLQLPRVDTPENLWKSYVSFCNLYSFFHFMAVASCHDPSMDEGAAKGELFRFLTLSSRTLLHNNLRRDSLQDEFFAHDSSTLAHMAILLSD